MYPHHQVHVSNNMATVYIQCMHVPCVYTLVLIVLLCWNLIYVVWVTLSTSLTLGTLYDHGAYEIAILDSDMLCLCSIHRTL